MGKEKDAAHGKKITNRDVVLVDELVRFFINGNPKERYKAQEDILEQFSTYISKYQSLFTGAQVDLRNYETRMFLGMFLTGRPKTPGNLAQQRAYISKVMARFEPDEIKNEIIIVFLGVLHKYRIYEGVNALNPLTKFFRFRLKDWFNRIVRDAMFRTVDVESFSHESDDGKKFTVEDWIDILQKDNRDENEEFSQFDITWMMNPYGNAYSSLDNYDRYFLSLMFFEDLSLPQIAEKLGRDRDTIRRHSLTLFEKLQAVLNPEEQSMKAVTAQQELHEVST